MEIHTECQKNQILFFDFCGVSRLFVVLLFMIFPRQVAVDLEKGKIMKKDVKERQSVTVNEKGQVLVPVPLRVNYETIVDGKVGDKPVVFVKIGARKHPCIIEMVTEEEYQTYMTYEQSVVKAEARKRRCLIPDGKCGLIMCPETNKCRCCEKVQRWDFDNGHDTSFEHMGCEDDNGHYEPYPVISKEVNDGGDLMANQLADMIEAELAKIKPKYALIFREMFNGTLKPNEIAANANLKTSTTYEDVPKVMAEAQKIFAFLVK